MQPCYNTAWKHENQALSATVKLSLRYAYEAQVDKYEETIQNLQ